LAGLSGVFYAHTLQFINPPDADFLKSVVILLAVVIGGRFSIHGSILGAGFLILVPELLRFVPRIINTPLNYFVDNGYISSKFSHTLILLLSSNMLIFSILVIIMMKKYPKGLVSLFPSKV
jgi:branched-chain amino acid transport system permease protein